MGDPIPRDGPPQSTYTFYRNALVVFGVSPWVFIS